LRFPSPSPEATRAAARALASAIGEAGLCIGLIGPLGAGKTLFVQGLAEGLGIDPQRVTSPTFVIASEYVTPAGRGLAHVDLYRLASRDELEATGFADLLAPGVVMAVEWADRLPEALPADRLQIAIERPAPEGAGERRVLNAVAFGNVAAAALSRWCSALGRDAALQRKPAG
jgi:tRNA threonylcarbamoyladenosine biosynthesis protein TsaE